MRITKNVIDKSAGDIKQQECIYRNQLRSKWGYSVIDNTDVDVVNWWHIKEG